MAQKMMTKAILDKIPAIYATENQSNTERKAYVKFFNPMGAQSWYGIEYNPETREFFGYVTGSFENEFGYFRLDELEDLRLPMGLRIERDIHFTPTPVADIVLGKVLH